MKRIYLAVAVLALLSGLGWLRSRPPAVSVAHPKVQSVTQSVSASGSVAGLDESDVAAELGGRLAHLRVHEGNRVARGQLLAELETSLLKAQLAQARAAVDTARAQLTQTARRPLASEVERAQAEVDQAQEVAEAQLEAARHRLQELQRGPTREELEQARGQALQALAQREQSKREAARLAGLYDQGYVTLQDLERARTQARVSENSYLTSYNRLRQQQVGTRPEVLQQARAQVDQSQASLQGARASGQARMQNLRDQPRIEDVRLAEARLREAELALEVARERLEQAYIRAPYDGTVTKIFLKAGQSTGANAPILHLVRGSAYEIQVNVDELNLGRLKVGQPAVVSSDAYPETFQARVRELSPQVVSERGTILVRLDPLKAPPWLRPGLTVSVNILFEMAKERPIVPLTSVTVAGRRSTLLVLRDGQLEEREVQLGAPGQDGFPVLSGVGRDDWVVVDRTNRLPGQKARAR
ncbi:efflux RND transporter periplasmic adaptor subunit [bacterium]|nr:efflux RND transporter periplasmic adaptor subunit [bacterium]